MASHYAKSPSIFFSTARRYLFAPLAPEPGGPDEGARTMKALTDVKILLIVTSHTQLGNTKEPTGFWLEELAAPYAEFTQEGAQVDIASPLGGKPLAGPKSEKEPNQAT